MLKLQKTPYFFPSNGKILHMAQLMRYSESRTESVVLDDSTAALTVAHCA